MIDESTLNAIVIEVHWLMQGQPVMAPHSESKDEYDRPLIVNVSHKTPLHYRQAYDVAYERAKTWAFECPDSPKKPEGWKPWQDIEAVMTEGEGSYGAKEPLDEVNPRLSFDSPPKTDRNP